MIGCHATWCEFPDDHEPGECLSEIYASDADERLAQIYDRDEGSIREEAAIRDDDPFP